MLVQSGDIQGGDCVTTQTPRLGERISPIRLSLLGSASRPAASAGSYASSSIDTDCLRDLESPARIDCITGYRVVEPPDRTCKAEPARIPSHDPVVLIADRLAPTDLEHHPCPVSVDSSRT